MAIQQVRASALRAMRAPAHAVDQDILVATGFAEGSQCTLRNVNPQWTERYAGARGGLTGASVCADLRQRRFDSKNVDIDPTKHDWGNYFKAGYKVCVCQARTAAGKWPCY